MSKTKRNVLTVRGIAILTVGLAMSSIASAADYVPFPGKIAVTLVRVETAKDIVVSFETWPGFARNTTIELPGIAIPHDSPQTDDCERQRAVKALAFTQQYFDEAKSIYVQDMRMETSADTTAFSDIISDQGSLTQALESQGLARSANVPAKTSWCR